MQATFENIRKFIQTLCHFNFVGTVTEDNSDKEDKITAGTVVTRTLIVFSNS